MSEVAAPNPADGKPAASAGATTPPTQANPAATTEAAKPAEAAAPGEAAKPVEGGEKKPEADPAAQKPVVPEKYDLKLPEGSLLDAKAVEKVSAFAKEKGLTNELAQAVLDQRSEERAEVLASQKADLDLKVNKWMEEASLDPEIGGAAFKENAELAKRVVDKYATDSFKKMLSETGIGNYPDFVRIFVKIGKEMADDTPLTGKQGSGSVEKPLSELFYPKKETK
jgi:hypothetical protein